MRLHCASVVILLGLFMVTDGESKKRVEPLRLVHFFGKTCTEPLFPGMPVQQCVLGSECQMMPMTPCLTGNCMSPFCVRSPDLPRVVSLVDNVGTCPISDASFNSDAGVFCINDTSCEINQKCCVSGNRIECLNVTSTVGLATYNALRVHAFGAPRRQIVEYCPTVRSGDFTDGCEDGRSCDMDSDCPGRQKCCVAGCRKRCLNPVSIFSAMSRTTRTGSDTGFGKGGVCPTVATDAVIANSSSCRDDFDCDGSRKCCAIARGIECLEANMYVGLPSAWTASSMISNRRGNPSVIRIRGSCPNISPLVTVPCGEVCANDTGCPLGMLCCHLSACMGCLNPIINDKFTTSRAGLCPTFALSTNISSEDNCTVDMDCTNPVMKCCPVGESSICVNPVGTFDVMIKRGSCPHPITVTTSGPSMCTGCGVGPNHPGRFRRQLENDCRTSPLRYKTCRSDADCGDAQKCCMNQCEGLSCTDPI